MASGKNKKHTSHVSSILLRRSELMLIYSTLDSSYIPLCPPTVSYTTLVYSNLHAYIIVFRIHLKGHANDLNYSAHKLGHKYQFDERK